MRATVQSEPIHGVPYSSRAHPALGIEPMLLSDLLTRASPEHFKEPQRPAFHLLILFTTGSGVHHLDFEPVSCSCGTLLHVRPGQVQQYGREPGLDAHVLLFRSEFVLPEQAPGETGSIVDGVAPTGSLQLGPEDFDAVMRAFESIEHEYGGTDGSALSARILQHLFHVLLLRLLRLSQVERRTEAAAYQEVYRRFRAELELRYPRTRCVEDYARRVGTSVKTLSRACERLVGVTPKQAIENRVVLEAKRLLAYTTLPISAIAQDVGFSEATNFSKFFCRLEGRTPSQFRAEHRG